MNANKPKRVTVLGSTGSIGRQTLELAARFPDRFEIIGLAAGKNIDLLAEQIRAVSPQMVSVADAESVDLLSKKLSGRKPEILSGEAGAIAVARAESDVVMAAMVGAAGLPPTLAAVEAGRDVALANKEVLVMAGELVTKAASKTGARLLPVDSEHCAIHQALGGRPVNEISRLVLTASGGPLLDVPASEFASITPARAIKHPRWDMGAKISVDSCTLLNKGFEVLEAKWLFGVPESQIGVVVHPEAIVHSLVEMVDGSTLAQLGIPDMAVPIAYAMAWPSRLTGVVAHANLATLGSLTFREPDHDRFPAVRLATRAASMGGTAPAMLVAADDVAVEAFLRGEIDFPGITRLLAHVLDTVPLVPLRSIDDVREAERVARAAARRHIESAAARRAIA